MLLPKFLRMDLQTALSIVMAFCTVASNYTTHLTANEVQHGPVLLEFTGLAMSLIPLKQLA